MITNLKKFHIDHRIFSDLERFIGFYELLSSSYAVMASMTKGGGVGMDSYVYLSIQGTLESMQYVLKNGRVGDAYALLTRYHDSAVINIYSNLYLIENWSLEKFHIEHIHDWLDGKNKLPSFKQMLVYIRKAKKVKAISDLFSDDYYKLIRERCNDVKHYNFFDSMVLNDHEIHLNDRLKYWDLLSKDLRDIFVFHMGYMFFLKEHYMSSSDYIDYREMGMTPPENSEYWVAPFIQEVFDSIILVERPDLAVVIRKESNMHL